MQGPALLPVRTRSGDTQGPTPACDSVTMFLLWDWVPGCSSIQVTSPNMPPLPAAGPREVRCLLLAEAEVTG